MKRLALIVLITALAGLLPAQAGDKKNPVVVMETSMGKITMELFEDKAPITVKNFLRYVDEKHYDGTIFHGVMPDFIIHGGGFLPGMNETREKHDPIKNEAGNGVSNKRGTIAMARTSDPDSATAQFFINVKDNPVLDRAGSKAGYAAFGQVLGDGMEVADKIRRVETGSRKGHDDVPRQDVVIKSIRRADKK
jgi:cyclophilin family peptidyl-prolyl cis-trans isomerase